MTETPAPAPLSPFRPKPAPGAQNDGRLASPSFDRNAQPIIAVLQEVLGGAAGRALEIGSGTGQHICAFAAALPALNWIPSDPAKAQRASIDAWAAHQGAPVANALDLDAAADWAADAALQSLTPLRAVISLNVIHVAPWAVAEGIVSGAARTLASAGWLFFYGPFRQSGVHNSEGNAAFDNSLRKANPEWGIRDIEAISSLADAAGFAAIRVFEMPSNNRILAFRSQI